ncbi:MAG: thioredoxin family protein [Candidatus Micrarchaeota archaeon]
MNARIFVLLLTGVAVLALFGCISPNAMLGGVDPHPKASLNETREVTLDFLYADWCSHCSNMKPIVAKMSEDFPKERFIVRYWNEAERKSDEDTGEIYARYEKAGGFKGFPTFVINGEKVVVGEKSEKEFQAWVCEEFSEPKPEACTTGN